MKKYKNIIFLNIVVFIMFFLLNIDTANSSAWLQEKNKFMLGFEASTEFSDIEAIFNKKDFTYYKTNNFKIYYEYGILEKLTIGGYIENYNLYSRYYDYYDLHKSKISDDYYGNIFLKQNLYNNLKNNITISTSYSFYFPIKYSKSENISNIFNRQNGYELGVNIGKNGEVFLGNKFDLYFKYFFNSFIGYKIINNTNNDELTFSTTIGVSQNNSSLLYIQYEYKDYPSSNILVDKGKFNKNLPINIQKIKIAHNYNIIKNQKIELSYQKIFSKTKSRKINADNVAVSLIINN